MRHAIWAAAAFLAFPAAALAEGPPCDERVLRGDYGAQITGTRPSGPPPAPTEQVIGIGTAHFDGTGGYSLVGTTHGSITGVSSNVPGSGTYTVNPDCTGSVVFQNAGQPFPLTVAIVVVDRGDEVKGVTLEPLGVMVSAVWRRR